MESRFKKNPFLRIVDQIAENGLESLGKWYSCYRAFVYDRDDPDSTQRLKLIIPDITGVQAYDYWAFPRNVFYGDSYGSQVIPQKGDVVWVEFEGGHPELPVWSLGHPAKREVPNSHKRGLIDKDTYWFLSPRGNLVIINDTKNLIAIQHSLGDYVELNQQSISLVTKRAISLGSLDKSEQPAVMGDDLTKVLEDMQKFMEDFSKALQKDITLSGGGPYLKFATMKIKIEGLVLLATELTGKIKKILSKLVTLNK